MVTELVTQRQSLRRPSALRFALLALVAACWGEAVGFPLMKAFALRSGLVAPGVSGWFMSALLLAGRFPAAVLRRRNSGSNAERALARLQYTDRT